MNTTAPSIIDPTAPRARNRPALKVTTVKVLDFEANVKQQALIKALIFENLILKKEALDLKEALNVNACYFECCRCKNWLPHHAFAYCLPSNAPGDDYCEECETEEEWQKQVKNPFQTEALKTGKCGRIIGDCSEGKFPSNAPTPTGDPFQ